MLSRLVRSHGQYSSSTRLLCEMDTPTGMHRHYLLVEEPLILYLNSPTLDLWSCFRHLHHLFSVSIGKNL